MGLQHKLEGVDKKENPWWKFVQPVKTGLSERDLKMGRAFRDARRADICTRERLKADGQRKRCCSNACAPGRHSTMERDFSLWVERFFPERGES
jgi:hypothetical protein